jgi:hypothetical protein
MTRLLRSDRVELQPGRCAAACDETRRDAVAVTTL